MAIYSIDLYRKSRNLQFFCLNGSIWIFLQKCLLSSPLRFIRLLSKSLNLIVSKGNKKGYFFYKILNIFSETIGLMKLISCIHIYDISLYKNCVLFSSRISTFVTMAPFHGLIAGMWKLSFFLSPLVYLDNILQNYLFSGPLCFI